MRDRDEGVAAGAAPYALAVVGVLAVATTAVETVVRLTGTPSFNVSFAAGVVTSVPFAVVLVAGPSWSLEDDVPTERYRRLGGWALAGGTLFVTLFSIIALSTFETFWNVVGTVRWAAAVGAGGGLVVGIFEVRAIERAVATERANVRASELERRKELLQYLNGVLRHEVLNTAQVIEGYADLLEDPVRGTDSTGEVADVIRKETRELRSVTDDVKVLLQSAEEPSETVPKDLARIVEAELDAVRDRYPGVEVEADVPADTYVRGDELLRRIFATLFDNAVEHDDSDAPRIAVSATETDDGVTVRVEDDGPGVPEEKRDELFEYTVNDGPGHDLGLAIVGTLADRYGGSVELERSGPGGSVFVVDLPRTDPPRTPESEADDPDRHATRVSQ